MIYPWITWNNEFWRVHQLVGNIQNRRLKSQGSTNKSILQKCQHMEQRKHFGLYTIKAERSVVKTEFIQFNSEQNKAHVAVSNDAWQYL